MASRARGAKGPCRTRLAQPPSNCSAGRDQSKPTQGWLAASTDLTSRHLPVALHPANANCSNCASQVNDFLGAPARLELLVNICKSMAYWFLCNVVTDEKMTCIWRWRRPSKPNICSGYRNALPAPSRSGRVPTIKERVRSRFATRRQGKSAGSRQASPHRATPWRLPKVHLLTDRHRGPATPKRTWKPRNQPTCPLCNCE
jgi:hypothetical protein